jgi:1-acyl-sn-glycerol-3-phosphate acyltransferase
LAPFVRAHVVNQEATRGGEPLIIAGNHIAHFDPPLISVHAHRQIDWMAMVELFENPFLGAWCRWVDAFPVDRARVDKAAVRAALARLKAGACIGLFPEGGIRDGAESVLNGAEIRPGIGALAQLSGAPVLPVAILGSDRLYAPRAWLPRRGTPVWIAYGEPMRCAGTSKAERQAFEHAFTEAIRALAADLQQRFQLRPEDLPQPAQRRKGRA